MARSSRKGSGGKKARRGGGRVRFLFSRARSALAAAALLGTGILMGLFWSEWRSAALNADAPADPAPAPLSERVKVEVLNGSGESGVARLVADRLVQMGFDVVAVDNADHFDHPSTRVLDRSGRPGAGERVAAAVGADSVAIALDRDLFLDATVIVGADWRLRIERAASSPP